MIDCNVKYICCKCSKAHERKITISEQLSDDMNLEAYIPAGWGFIEIKHVRFITCGDCFFNISLSLITPPENE